MCPKNDSSRFSRNDSPGRVDPRLHCHRVWLPLLLWCHPQQGSDDHSGNLSYFLYLLLVFNILKGVLIMEDLEDCPNTAWKENDAKQDIMKNKTKKSVALELSLFSVVFLSFVIFNIYYWTEIYMYT